MSRASHLAVVRAAERTDQGLKRLFTRLGNSEHPEGQVFRTYRTLRTAVGAVLAQGRGVGERAAIRGLLLDARANLAVDFNDFLHEAADLGIDQAEAQVDAYGLGGFTSGLDTERLQEALNAWLGVFDSQVAGVEGALILGADDAFIVGDEEQAGLLTPTPLTQAGASWLSLAAQWGFWWLIEEPVKRKGIDWWKQAIAAIDHRTTECCLRVHGQAVPLDKDFHLTGSPAYADYMDWPPFHRWCRTSVALVPKEDVEDVLTHELRDAASAELRAREESGRQHIWPSHGRSRRRGM